MNQYQKLTVIILPLMQDKIVKHNIDLVLVISFLMLVIFFVDSLNE